MLAEHAQRHVVGFDEVMAEGRSHVDDIDPPAENDHADGAGASTPVQRAGYATPRRMTIVNGHQASC